MSDQRALPWWAYVLMMPPCLAAAIMFFGWFIETIVEMGGG